MQTFIETETKASLVIATVISTPFILNLKKADDPKQLVVLSIGYAVMVLLLRILFKSLLSRIRVRDSTHRIIAIKDNTPSTPFQVHQTVSVDIEDATGRIRTIETYKELTKGLQQGQIVGVVKRPARHTYEIDQWHLIPVDRFDVKKEREKYVKGIEMDGTPDTGWLSHLTIEGLNNQDRRDV